MGVPGHINLFGGGWAPADPPSLCLWLPQKLLFFFPKPSFYRSNLLNQTVNLSREPWPHAILLISIPLLPSFWTVKPRWAILLYSPHVSARLNEKKKAESSSSFKNPRPHQNKTVGFFFFLKPPSKLAGLFVLLQDVKMDSRVSLVEDERRLYGFLLLLRDTAGDRVCI